MFKNNVDFFFIQYQRTLIYTYKIYVTKIRYLSCTYWENVMHLPWIYAKLSFIEDTYYCWPGARQWRHVRIAFHSSNQTYYQIFGSIFDAITKSLLMW